MNVDKVNIENVLVFLKINENFYNVNAHVDWILGFIVVYYVFHISIIN
jgi:hypothetical protein